MSLVRTYVSCSKATTFVRFYSVDTSGLKKRLAQIIPGKQEEVANIKKELGEKVIHKVTVEQAYNGMRDIKSLVTETTLLDANEGIRFRGYSIPECQKLLPRAQNSSEPLPESLLWLLMTGEIPTQQQALDLSKELSERARIPDSVHLMLDNFPANMHPMTQFSAGILGLQPESQFAKAYNEGINKKKYWEHTYEDALNLIATVPLVAARIYRNL